MIFLGAKYQIHLEEEASLTYELTPVLLFASVFPIVIGVLLRLPKWLIEINENKSWTFDWMKLVVIGLPALYIALLPVLSANIPMAYLLFAEEIMFMNYTILITTAGIVFGYVLLDSLKK
ncbi:hypothetical protein SAMN04487943_102285 [Gracilibacillus orientalis]|uniref:Uncharacterized protein n=1 Tax=Gracilibacillus orientalis TaxID=334253 RepID=A0A1I4ITA1_9BACI|nr:hypothetical protein SAMN04487943_102285 [Gracilibacillus orientalis]